MSGVEDLPGWAAAIVSLLLILGASIVLIGALGLLRADPFPGTPPRYVRAQYYRYRFTTADERRATRAWWSRELVGTFYGPVSLARP